MTNSPISVFLGIDSFHPTPAPTRADRTCINNPEHLTVLMFTLPTASLRIRIFITMTMSVKYKFCGE